MSDKMYMYLTRTTIACGTVCVQTALHAQWAMEGGTAKVEGSTTKHSVASASPARIR